MVVAIVALSIAYPFFGFMRRTIKGNFVTEQDIIIKAFETQGFRLHHRFDYRLVFVANSIIKRITMLFEDHILVTQIGDEIEIRGNRKGVAYVVYRLEAALERERELEAQRLQRVKAEVETKEVGEAAEV